MRDKNIIDVIATKHRIAICRTNFNNSISYFKN